MIEKLAFWLLVLWHGNFKHSNEGKCLKDLFSNFIFSLVFFFSLWCKDIVGKVDVDHYEM